MALELKINTYINGVHKRGLILILYRKFGKKKTAHGLAKNITSYIDTGWQIANAPS